MLCNTDTNEPPAHHHFVLFLPQSEHNVVLKEDGILSESRDEGQYTFGRIFLVPLRLWSSAQSVRDMLPRNTFPEIHSRDKRRRALRFGVVGSDTWRVVR